MYNLMGAELYKLKKSKVFWICCALPIALLILFLGACVAFGERPTIADVFETMFSGMVCIAALVFCTVFSLEDYKNGAVKNIAGKGYGRGSVFAARYAVTLFGTFFIMLMAALITPLIWMLYMGVDGLNIQVLEEMCLYVGMQWAVGLGAAGFYVALCECSRSLGVALSVGLGLQLFMPLLTTPLDKLVEKWGFSVSEYVVFMLMQVSIPSTGFEKMFLIRSVLAGIGWIVVMGGIGLLHFQKADIK